MYLIEGALSMRYIFPLGLAMLFAVPAQATTGIDQIPVCYDFGCQTRQVISITASQWQEVSGWFYPQAKTPEAEREQIKKAIGWMEVVVGQHTPTHRDTGLDLQRQGVFPGQLDCIDESLNTTTYLKLFEQNSLLRHHRVLDRAYRRAIFDQHWAGQIEEIDGGARFTVDSWFQKNGILPYIQNLAEWEDISFFYSSNVDNSNEYETEVEQKPSLWRRLTQRTRRLVTSSD